MAVTLDLPAPTYASECTSLDATTGDSEVENSQQGAATPRHSQVGDTGRWVALSTKPPSVPQQHEIAMQIIDDFANAEDIPLPLRHHMKCATVALFREESEDVAIRGPYTDLVTRYTRLSQHSSSFQADTNRRFEESQAQTFVKDTKSDTTLTFQEAYSRMVRDPELRSMIVHMENMYAAAVQDLVRAKDSTLRRKHAIIQKLRRQTDKNIETPDSGLAKRPDPEKSDVDISGHGSTQSDEHLEVEVEKQKTIDERANSTEEIDELLRKYDEEIAQTKSGQRFDFHEFIVTQYSESQLASTSVDQQSDIKSEQTLLRTNGADKFRQKGSIPGAASRRRATKLKKGMLEVLVRRGFPALMKEINKRDIVEQNRDGSKSKGYSSSWNATFSGFAAAAVGDAFTVEDRVSDDACTETSSGYTSKGGNNSFDGIVAEKGSSVHQIDNAIISPVSDEKLGIEHISSQLTKRHVRFVACFGQQSKSTVVVEMLAPRESSDGFNGVSSLFAFSSAPETSKRQREKSVKRLCSQNSLAALVLPLTRSGNVDADFLRACGISTEFFFGNMDKQIQRGLEDHCRKSGQQVENEASLRFGNGSAVVTRHSNLCGLNLTFHMARDCDYCIDVGKDDTNTSMTKEVYDRISSEQPKKLSLSVCKSEDQEIDGSSLREGLSKGVKSIVRVAAASGVSMVYIPCDLYCPSGEGFGTRDFSALVRDVRATTMELISAQRRQKRQHLKCIRFLLTQKGGLDDELLIKSMAEVLKEKFDSDMFKEQELR